jgi:phosphate-selective porin OprO/OprP
VHLGLAARYAEAENGTFQFRERPEANTAPEFLDTGAFPADSSRTLDLEFATVNGPVSFQGEYLKTWVDSPETGDPRFDGWYLAASWILTGESRSYMRRGGFFFKLDPERPVGGGGIGAWELTLRYSSTDFKDGSIDGGEFERWSIGANWYATSQWRLEVNVGRSTLKRFDTNGDTEFLQLRLQWLF